MRDVNYGWLIRYMHTNGASLFFLACYIHIFRGLYYGSYKPPRELLWIIGVIIYFLMTATAFLGYVLPWGSMSFAGATVITNLVTAIPVVGTAIAHWLWGGFAVGAPTAEPVLLAALSPALHHRRVRRPARLGAARHRPEQSRTASRSRTSSATRSPFTPYATIKDIFAVSVWFILYAWLIFFIPNYLLDADNSNIANPLVTPAHVVPEWYLLPFYAILRAIPNKLVRRHRAVRLDRDPRLRSLARPQSGQVGEISPGVPVLLLGVRRDLHPARLDRLAGAERGDDAGRAFR